MEHFEIRQQVATVSRQWLEVVHSGLSHRVMEATYRDLVSANPSEYFEFVRVLKTEECLEYTPKQTPNAKLCGGA